MKTTSDGNVIHHDFGRRSPPPDFPAILAAVQIVHADEEIAVVRLEVQIGEESWVSHALYPTHG